MPEKRQEEESLSSSVILYFSASFSVSSFVFLISLFPQLHILQLLVNSWCWQGDF